jgi:hypothetical protein
VLDYAHALAACLGPAQAEVLTLDPASAHAWRMPRGSTVFLQWSPYGYQKRGVPFWLLRELRARRAEMHRLGVFFHELYAFGPPWRSSFWLSALQRQLCADMARLADCCVTSREAAARWLQKRAPDRPCAVLPVFSSVGEPAFVEHSPSPGIVVFGSPPVRAAAYVQAGDGLFEWASRIGGTIHDVGAPLEPTLRTAIAARGVLLHGRLPATELAEVFAQTTYGVLAYPAEYLAKSSVFAAYAANGLCPVVLSARPAPADGLVPGEHYANGLTAGTPQARRTARAAHGWYQGHTLARHAQLARTMLMEDAEAP